MNYPSPKQIPKAIIWLAIFGLVVLIATRGLTTVAGKTAAAIS